MSAAGSKVTRHQDGEVTWWVCAECPWTSGSADAADAHEAFGCARTPGIYVDRARQARELWAGDA